MSQTILEPEVLGPGSQSGRWMVVIYNNEYNSMDEVIEILMVATECTLQEAYIEMWEAHTFGKASVHFGNRQECDDAATVIQAVGIRTEVTLEWAE